MNHKCLNCGKEYAFSPARRKTCSDLCGNQYRRKAETLNKSYAAIKRIAKSNPHMRSHIAKSLSKLEVQVMSDGVISWRIDLSKLGKGNGFLNVGVIDVVKADLFDWQNLLDISSKEDE